MKKHELEKVISLHHKAYAVLNWIMDQHRLPYLVWFPGDDPKILVSGEIQEKFLAEESLRMLLHPGTCVKWVKKWRDIMPDSLKPSESEIGPFSYLLSAFLNTSFHIERIEYKEGQRFAKIVPGHARPINDKRKKKN